MADCEPCEWCDREQEWERIHDAEARQASIHSVPTKEADR